MIASWGVHAPRCTIGSALDASVRVQEGNLAPNHVLLIFGKKFTLLKALAQPTRVSGRPVKEWLIDRSTTIELGELTFVVHPFQARPTSTVVRGERIPEIASRMGAEPPQVTQVAPVESHSNPATGPSNTSFPLVEPVGLSQGYETQLPAPIFLNVESTAAHHVAPEVLGQIKENMESLTAAVAALKANSVQNQLDAQATTESVVLASTQKMMEGFADRWFTDIRRELGTFGTQQQESVLALSQSLDSRLNNLEQRIETIGISSSEEMRVLADKISSLADDQCELRSSVSEMSSCQRGTILSPESVPAISSESLEFTERTRDSLPYVGDQSFSRSIESLPRLNSLPPSMERLPEADRHARMDGSDWDRKNSSDFSGQSAPYYASNLPEPELRVEQDFGESFQSAGEPEVAYEKAPHAMQWDAPVDESSDQSYVELLRRLERSQIEVERRSESLLAPELPSEVTEEPSVREPSIREPGGSNDWGSRGIEPNSNSLAQREFADPTFSDRQESGSSLSNRQTYGTPIAGDSTEEREYLRSLSVGQNLEAESVDLRQLQVGLDSDAIGNRLERLLAEASDRRKVPQATENPLERLQLYNHDVPEESSPALQPQQEIRNAKPFFAEQLLRHSTELQGDVTPGENAEDTGERELQALYASLGLVRNPGKGVDEQARPHGVSLEIAAERSRRETDADREYPSGVVGEDEIDASSLNALDEEELPPHQEQIDERAGFEEGGVQELQRPNNFEDLPELQVHNGASAVSASQRSNAANVESVEESNTEEESIEEYMQRLLQRVRSGPNSAPASDAAINRKSSLPSIPKRVTELPDRSVDFSISALSPSISEVSSASTPLSRPFTSLPLRAASRAPEAKADLDALRELANSNARRAIKRSDKRRNSTDLLVNVAVCAFSLACGLALLVMNGFRINVTFLGMTSAFLVSILWGVDSVRSYLVMLREQRNGIPTGNGSGE
ncbi:MAG: hypothetical protein FJ308_03620 [Planctomycetes bacterium]|nr:hypothetical protein [Planctomycetota bacterium]